MTVVASQPAPEAGCLRHLSAIAEIPAQRWDALFGPDYPFAQHRFLNALETSGSVSPDTGWTPHHLVLEDAGGQLQAACPLYVKAHSYGEFVFDFTWARAAAQLGQAYYPRLVAAIPFTPSSGPRWAAVNPQAEARLLGHLAGLAAEQGRSSLHALFLTREQGKAAAAHGASLRHDVQYQWFNRNYPSFDDFLGALASAKRKKLRRERQKLRDAGIVYRREAAHTLDRTALDAVYALYASTYAMRGQAPYLNRAFFDHYLQDGDSPLWVLSGRHDNDPQHARRLMALFFVGTDTLFGRHWGATHEMDGAHFETCYYQGIDWCIDLGLQRFDAGTQGEHKRTRGFEPVVTTSAHWLTHPRLRAAVDDYLDRERAAVTEHAALLAAHHSAYRQGSGGGNG